jgi:UDP-2,3-diacylglucosamine pyrophosphatase LpxH
MSDKAVTLIVSDLHVGGGQEDPGDDHVFDKSQFREFIRRQAETPEGKKGDIELIINGDFLEFAQVNANAYQLGSADFWCSEDESLQKLRPILSGHEDIFAELKRFQSERGNKVTLAAGNHDVDLWWGRVQSEIQAAAGPVQFEKNDLWYQRHEGKLRIAHGHMFDPANKFKNWSNPVLDGPDNTPRLEMCPGTLFMVKFVNWLEHDYPFADNLKPVTALRSILWKESRFSLVAAAWVLAKFTAQHRGAALGMETADEQVGTRIAQRIKGNAQFAEDVARLYRKVRNHAATAQTVRDELQTEADVMGFLFEMMPCVAPEEWMPVFNIPGAPKLSIGGDATTLSVFQSGTMNDKQALREEAAKVFKQPNAPQVVVMGHTHQPDRVQAENGVYYNPGSWTRYIEIEKTDKLTLEDLKDESRFPYRLNYVRVERQENGSLASELITHDSQAGKK